jgi:rubrerythrin
MRKKPTDVGKNRTGVALSPLDAKKTIEGAAVGSPAPRHDAAELQEVRLAYSKEAPPMGTMPAPATLKGLGKTIVDAVTGDKTTVLLDKLGERLAFERSGVRLYELLLIKHDAGHPHQGGPTREELEAIRDDELRHFGVLVKAIRELGADPTAVTPCANAVAVASMGLVQLLADPRTTLTQGLDAILMAELADNDGWDMLLELADAMGKDELVADLRTAQLDERRHLAQVRAWIATALLGQAGAKDQARRRAADADAGASAPPHH